MAMWRCPHCGTPQAETARCWVCRRSSTSCGTCRHFRASVAANMGYCGLDRQRRPLSGDEIRACWDSHPEQASAPVATPSPAVSMRTAVPRREFVEVKANARPSADRRRHRAAELPPTGAPTPAAISPRWSLWEDVEG